MKTRLAAILLSALVASLHTACFNKPDAPMLSGGSGSGSGSGTDVDAPLARCGASDTFDTGASACGTWGTLVGNGMLRKNGHLEALPFLVAVSTASTSCVTAQPFNFQNGASIEIVNGIDTQMSGDAWFAVYSGAGSDAGIKVDLNTTTGTKALHVTCVGSTTLPVDPPYDAAAHRWWRFTVSGSNVTILNGPDASSLTTYGLCPWSLSTATAFAEIGASIAGGDATGSAVFDNFNTINCPPAN